MTSYFDGITVLAMDLVGTLIFKPTPRFYIAASDFLARHAKCVTPDRFRRTFRRRYWEHSIGNYETDREFYSAVLADLSLAYDPAVEALTNIYLNSSPAFTDASSFLEQMCSSYKLVLASNYVGPWARRILESNGWHSYFHGALVSSDCGFRKPARQFFRELLTISGASRTEVLMIGDSLVNDAYGATAAGCKSVLLDRDGGSGGDGLLKRVLSFSSLHELAGALSPERIALLRG